MSFDNLMRGDHSKAAPTVGGDVAFAIAALQVFPVVYHFEDR